MKTSTPDNKFPETLTTRRKSKKQKLAMFLIVLGGGSLIGTKVFTLLFYLDPILGLYSLLTTFLVFISFIVSYIGYEDPLNYHAKNNKKNEITSTQSHNPLVSIVIPAKNDPVMIAEITKSVMLSSYENFELILVNDGSTDNTGKVMDELKNQYANIKIIHLKKNLGKRKAVREGILTGPASGEIILFIDSDCVIERTAIERLVKVFEDPDIGAVSGHGRALNKDDNALTKMQDTWYDGQFSIMKAIESVFGTVTCCPGILAAYRREAIMPALDKWANDQFLGSEFTLGDDRHLTSYVIGGNQHYLGKQHRVWKVKYCESAIVYTIVPTKFKTLVLQQIRWKKSWFRVFFFTAPYYYKNRNPFAASLYYLSMLWSFFSPVVAFRSLVYLPLQGSYLPGLVYLVGLIFIGLLFAAEFKLRNPDTGNQWVYRLYWQILGFFFSSLEFYSFLTIRNKSWLTR
ncbi:MAG: glycosyltransferase [Nitrosopumilus sp.]|nr:glycosyltransferase [Nitrosopumilus sp.]